MSENLNDSMMYSDDQLRNLSFDELFDVCNCKNRDFTVNPLTESERANLVRIIDILENKREEGFVTNWKEFIASYREALIKGQVRKNANLVNKLDLLKNQLEQNNVFDLNETTAEPAADQSTDKVSLFLKNLDLSLTNLVVAFNYLDISFKNLVREVFESQIDERDQFVMTVPMHDWERMRLALQKLALFNDSRFDLKVDRLQGIWSDIVQLKVDIDDCRKIRKALASPRMFNIRGETTLQNLVDRATIAPEKLLEKSDRIKSDLVSWLSYSRDCFSRETAQRIDNYITIDPHKIREERKSLESNQRVDRRQMLIELRQIVAGEYPSRKNYRVESIDFEVFPRGTISLLDFVGALRRHGISVNASTQRRLEQIESEFEYSIKCIGKRGFEGYVVYRFQCKNLVIAEKPEYGNATYLVKGDWEEIKDILKKSRWEARERHPTAVKRIIHYEDESWMRELRHAFRHWS